MRTRRLAILLLPMLVGCGYNTIQKLDEQTNQTRSQIEVQLQRRADLIPNLVNTVKGYAQHEEQVFIQVARARSGLLNAINSHDPQAMADSNAQLTAGLGRLLAVAENYPQLKANEGFLRLQDELTGTENRIAVARGDYNQAAQQYNTYIRTFPQTLTAKVIGAKAKPYFEVTTPGSREAPKVDFGTPSPPAAQPQQPGSTSTPPRVP